jgi:hypothetical protein
MRQKCALGAQATDGEPLENRWSRRPDRVVRKDRNVGFLPIRSLDRASSAHPDLFQLADVSNCMRQFWRMPRLK